MAKTNQNKKSLGQLQRQLTDTQGNIKMAGGDNKPDYSEMSYTSITLLAGLLASLFVGGDKGRGVFSNIDQVKNVVQGKLGLVNYLDSIKKNVSANTKTLDNIYNLLKGNNNTTITNQSNSNSIQTDLTPTVIVNIGDDTINSGISKQLDNDLKVGIGNILAASSVVDLFDKIDQIKNDQTEEVKNKIKAISENIYVLDNIFDQINKSLSNNKITEETVTSILLQLKVITSIFSSLESVHEINPLKLKFNLWFTKKFLTKDIIEILTILSKSADKINKASPKPLEAIGGLFKAISIMSDITLKQQLRMYMNIGFIRLYITTLVDNVLSALANASNKFSKDGVESLAKINQFIELINFILDAKLMQLILKLPIKSRILAFILSDAIGKMVGALKTVTITKEEVENLIKLFEFYKNFDNYLPGLMSMAKMGIKFELINSLINDNIYDVSEGLQFTSKSIAKIKKTDYDNIRKLFGQFNNKRNSIGEAIVKLIDKKDMQKAIDLLKSLKTINKLMNAKFEINDNLKDFINGSLKEFVSNFEDKPDTIGYKLKNIIILDPNISKSIGELSKALKEMNALAGVLKVIGTLKLGKALNVINEEAQIIQTIVAKFEDLKQSDIDKANQTIKSFNLTILALASILIFGSLAMTLIKPKNLILFTACLSGFLFATLSVFNVVGDAIAKSLDGAKDAVKLIATASFIMLLGGTLMNFVDLANLGKFTLTLTMFLMGVLGTIFLFRKIFESSHAAETLDEIRKLIIVTAGILIAASLISKLIDVESLWGFIAIHTVFLFSILGVYGIAGIWMKKTKTMEIAKDFMILVAVTGGILLAAALMSSIIDPLSLGIFAGCLLGLILTISLSYKVFLQVSDDVNKAAMNLAILVAVSGGILMAGAIITQLVGPANIILFAALLFGFIFGVTWAYEKNLKGINQALGLATELAILVAASGIILILAGKLMGFGELVQATAFAAILFGFIFGVTWAYNKNARGLKRALANMGGLAILVAASGIILILAGKLMNIGEILQAAAFALVLAGFIYLLTKVAFSNKNTKAIFKAIVPAVALGIIIAISGAVLIFAGKMMGTGEIANAALFALVLTGFLRIMAPTLNYVARRLPKSILRKALYAVGAILLITFVSTLVFEQVAKLIVKYNWDNILIGTVTILGCLTILGAGYMGLGYLLFLDGGTGLALGAVALSAISGLTILTTYALKTIGENQKYMNVGNIKNFQTAVAALVAVGVSLAPIALMAGQIVAASVALTALCLVIDKMAEAVKNYAELKIPVYQGTKVVEYRNLKSSDFKNAAYNIDQIISVLGRTIIKTYKRDPEIFNIDLLGNSTFGKVCRALKNLAPLISSIAKSVKEYADMTIPIYQGTKVVGYDHLDKEDFVKAGQHVSEIISTLGKAIVSTYENSPELFETNFWGNSPFGKVCRALKNLSPLISSISKSIENYANLKIADYGDIVKYDKNGNPLVQSYKPMDDTMFDKAAENVKKIITVLGGAVVAAYNAHPDYYDGDTWFTSSPFSKTVKANLRLATLITKIAGAVKDYANMTAPVYDDITGEVIKDKVRVLDDNDFKKASTNVLKIMNCLGGAIIALYEEHPDYYDGDTWFSSSPFSKTVKANLRLATLITKIAGAVKDYANMTAPAYDVNGEIIKDKVRVLNQSDFKKASENIQYILTTLGQAVIDTYNANPQMYESGGFLGMGDSPFEKAINANVKMSKLISGIAKGVQSMAKLMIPEYGEGDNATKIIRQRPMTETDFENAAKSIDKIITLIGNTIISQVDKHPEYFEDGDDSIFAETCQALTSMANMMSNLAEGVKAMAELKIPIYGDSKDPTKITGYKQLGEQDFTDASDNIDLIISILGQSVINEYNNHPEYFDDGEDSTFNTVCTSLGTMGQMLSTIAQGVKDYAELKIPVKWNNDGEPIEYRELGKTDFTDAASNVSEIISTLGGAVMQVYNQHQNDGMFDLPSPNNLMGYIFGDSASSDNPFIRVVKSCMTLGQMLEMIAESVQTYAMMQVPEYDDHGRPTGNYRQLGEKDFTDAATNIKEIISTLGGAIIDLYKDPNTREMFDIPGPNSLMGAIFGEENTDSIFLRVIQASMSMGKVIDLIAQGVKEFASMTVQEFDDNGHPIPGQVVKLDPQDFERAGQSIASIITCIGKSIAAVYNENPDIFKVPSISGEVAWGLYSVDIPTGNSDDSPIMIVLRSTSMMAKAISAIGKAIVEFASASIPERDKDGKPTGNTIGINKAVCKSAAENIGEIITILGKTVNNIYKKNEDLFGSDTILTLMKSFKVMGDAINSIAKGVQAYANLTVPVYDAKGFLVEGKREKIPPTMFDEAAENVQKIMLCLLTKVSEVANSPAFKEEGPAVENVAKVFKMVSDTLLPMADAVKEYARLTFKDVDGKMVRLEPKDIGAAADNIGKVLKAIGNAVVDTVTGNENIFGPNMHDMIFSPGKVDLDRIPAYVAAKVIGMMANPVTEVADVLKIFAGEETVITTKDSNGNIRIEKKTYPDIGKAQEKIKNILIALGEVITETYNGHKDDGLFDTGKDSPAYQIAGAISALTGMLQEVVQNIAVFAKFDKINGVSANIDTITENVKHMFKGSDGSGGIISLFNYLEDAHTTMNISELAEKWGAVKGSTSITDIVSSLTSTKNDDNSYAGKFSKLMQSVTRIIVSAQAGFYLIAKETKINHTIFSSLIIDIIDSINAFNDIFDHLNNTLFTLAHRIQFINLIKYKDIYSDGIDEGVQLVKQVLTGITHIQLLYSKMADVDLSNKGKLYKLLYDFLNIVALLQSIHKNITAESSVSILGGFINYSSNQLSTDTTSLVDDIDRYIKSIKQITELAENAQDIGIDGYDTISEGIDKIYQVTSKIKDSSKFKQHQEVLSKYVKSINGLDISKIDKMINMVNAMNILAARLGNLDEFTNVLANNITDVLDKLVKELKISKEVIDKAEKIQNKRHDLIKNSINDIKSVMNQTLSISISAVNDNESLTEGGETTTPPGTTPTTTTPSSISTTADNNSQTRENGERRTTTSTAERQAKTAGGTTKTSTSKLTATYDEILTKLRTIESNTSDTNKRVVSLTNNKH